jgi:hypothetical protein
MYSVKVSSLLNVSVSLKSFVAADPPVPLLSYPAIATSSFSTSTSLFIKQTATIENILFDVLQLPSYNWLSYS